MENVYFNSNRTLEVAVKIGVNMLKCGAEVGRVEKTMAYICKAYGADQVDCFSLPTLVLLSATFNGHQYATKVGRNLQSSFDLYRIEKYNQLSRRITKEKPSFDEVDKCIEYIETKKDYILYIFLIGAFLSSLGFAVFFGGSYKDGISSGLIGVLMTLLNLIKPKNANQILHTLIASLIGGLLCSLTYMIGLSDNLDSVMIGAIMILIPGINLSISIRDIFIDDVLSGTLKFMQSIVTSLAIAAGFSVWTLILNVNISLELAADPFNMIIAGVIGTTGFSILFNSKYKRLPFAILTGLITTVVYVICIYCFKLNNLFTNLISAFVAGILAEIIARIIKAPTTSFLLPGLIPLVPGASLFYTMYYLINSQNGAFVSTLISTLIAILALAFGMVVSQVIYMYIPKKKKKIEK